MQQLFKVPNRLIFLGLLLVAGVVHAELPDFTRLVEQNSAAVVHISAQRARSASQVEAQPDDLPEWLDRFRENGNEDPVATSTGSGFVVEPDGYILTNFHVVHQAEEIVVRLLDRSEFVAQVVGTDVSSDIALLKINASGLPVMALGASDSLKSGEWVIAIGSPFGFDHSVTAGIVSAKGRSFLGQQYVPFIQTDVPINRGNSGGPLINMAGQAVGINSQIFSSTGGYVGLSFAIPIEVAMAVANQLKAQGKVERGLLGVGIQVVRQDMAVHLGMDRAAGALVNYVEPGSAAGRAGVQVGDVITRYNGNAVENHQSLPLMVGLTPPGSQVEVSLFRNGEELTLQAQVDAVEAVDFSELTSFLGPETQTEGDEHIRVEDLTQAERTESRVPTGGVIVREIQSKRSLRAGLRAGDIILRVNRSDVEDPAHYRRLMEQAGQAQTVSFLVNARDGSRNFIVLEPGAL